MKTNIKRKLLVIAMSAMLVMASLTPVFAYGEGETPADFFEFDAETGTIKKFLKNASGAPTEVVIPRKIGDVTVEHIADRVFYDCSSLTSVTIPESVTSIGEKAFYMCRKLKSITIPDGVTSVEYQTFLYAIA